MATIALWAGAAVQAATVPEPVAAMQRLALADDGAWRIVESLTTEVGQRFSGSPGDRAAIAWAEAKLRALGFPKVWSEPVTVPHWVRGEAAAEIVAPWPQRLVVAALGGSVGTPAGGIEAEVVAAENLDALAKLPDESVRGHIVFFYERMQRSADGSGYGKTVAIRARGPAAAAAKGALAVVIRSVGTDHNRLAHTGGTRYQEGVVRIPAAALSVPDAELLERELDSGRPVRLRLELGCRDEGEAESANVIGEFPGRELPDEIVLLAAHRDSWDVGQGAQDNGTGVALVSEAARLAAAASGNGGPRRTLRVLLTANEEFGLSGARAYAERHAAELAGHVVAVEADIGGGRVLAVHTRFADSDGDAARELADLTAPLGLGLAPQPAFGGADLSPLVPAGVPMVDLAQDASLYFDIHHTDNDTLDQIDPANLRQASAAYATFAWWAANRVGGLARVPAPPASEN